ncbi:MAG TPA: hypothetical protein PLD92_00500 [Candidatus Omnitrophota bacterium]|nr:hypothetical protein [Candidatus Omnitrophota bacterium]
MNHKKNFAVMLWGIMFFGFAVTAVCAGTLTLTTYYPAPFGSYSQLRLVPRTAISGACDVGSMYVDQATGLLMYCRSDSTYGLLPTAWTQDANAVFLTDVTNYSFLKVGIGTINPDSLLQVEAQGTDATFKVDQMGGSAYVVRSQATNSSIGTTGNTSLQMNTKNTARIHITSQGKVGVNMTNPTQELVVKGGVEITVDAGQDSQVTFSRGTTFVTMGLDAADNYFKINYGTAVGATTELVLLPSGKLRINGPIEVKLGSDPIGEIKLRYIDTGDPNTSGYYAMYAP